LSRSTRRLRASRGRRCRRRVGAEGRDLDDLAAEDHVREAEAPADQAQVAEQRLDLLGRRVGGDVEILRMAADQQVAHGAADQEAPKPPSRRR
jgi:hypothetical protein